MDEPIYEDKVRFVCISDTHNKLGEILPRIPRGDVRRPKPKFIRNPIDLIKVLLHCGDFTNFGDANELDEFNEELAKLPHKYKIVIAGNHELGFEDGEDLEGRKADKVMWELGSGRRGTPRGYERLTNCIYLHDNSVKVFPIIFDKNLPNII